jgi:hypothetical protein
MRSQSPPGDGRAVRSGVSQLTSGGLTAALDTFLFVSAFPYVPARGPRPDKLVLYTYSAWRQALVLVLWVVALIPCSVFLLIADQISWFFAVLLALADAVVAGGQRQDPAAWQVATPLRQWAAAPPAGRRG